MPQPNRQFQRRDFDFLLTKTVIKFPPRAITNPPNWPFSVKKQPFRSLIERFKTNKRISFKKGFLIEWHTKHLMFQRSKILFLIKIPLWQTVK